MLLDEQLETGPRRLDRLLAAAAVPGLALAQPAAKPADETKPITRIAISDKLNADYADLDADKDGRATSEEINARLVKTAEADVEVLRKARDDAFARLDTNKDGTISKAEFDAKAPLPTIKEPNAQPFLDRFDSNKDGSISQDATALVACTEDGHLFVPVVNGRPMRFEASEVTSVARDIDLPDPSAPTHQTGSLVASTPCLSRSPPASGCVRLNVWSWCSSTTGTRYSSGSDASASSRCVRANSKSARYMWTRPR